MPWPSMNFIAPTPKKAGATYIDVWEAFADEAGQYSAIGPDINGQTVRLRAADGVHFTKAGARKLAHFVEPEIRRNLDEVQPNTAPTPNLANVPNPDNAGTPSNLPALPGSEAPPAPKPVAGPILPLTGPVLAPGGELATRTTTAGTANNTARSLIEQTLQYGRPACPEARTCRRFLLAEKLTRRKKYPRSFRPPATKNRRRTFSRWNEPPRLRVNHTTKLSMADERGTKPMFNFSTSHLFAVAGFAALLATGAQAFDGGSPSGLTEL